MAKTNLFRAYGGNRNDESKRPIKKDELNFVSVEVSETPREELQITQEVETPIGFCTLKI